MRHHLSRSISRICEAEPVNNIIKSCLQHLEQSFASNTAFAERALKVAAKLALHQTILKSELLLLCQCGRIIGALAAGSFRPLPAGREGFAFQGRGVVN